MAFDAYRLKLVTRGSSNSLPGPMQDSFVATVSMGQQRSVMAIQVKRFGSNGNSSTRRRHLFGYPVFLVASFRRVALLIFQPAFRGKLGDVNRFGCQRMFVTNGCTTNGGWCVQRRG